MLLMCSMTAITAVAQINGTGGDLLKTYEDLCKKKSALEEKKSILEEHIKILKRDSNRICGKTKDLTKDIEKQKKKVEDLEKKKNYQEYLTLIRQRDSLKDIIRTKEEQLGDNKEILQQQHQQLQEKESRVTALKEIQDGVSKDVTQQINAYLQKKFSEMSIVELDRLVTEYKKFEDDKEVKKTLKKVEDAKNQKMFFDRMVSIVSSPYNKVDLDKALTDADKKFKGIIPSQKQEVEEVKKQMKGYKEGVINFKKLIEKFKEKRTLDGKDMPNYSNFFKDDYDKLYRAHKEHINKIIAIPYLKAKLEELKTAYLKNDKGKRDKIENEIKSIPIQ